MESRLNELDAAQYRSRIQELEDRIRRLERILGDGVCKTCGGVSWDIGLSDYCKCNAVKEVDMPVFDPDDYPLTFGELDS